jgi:glyoxylase-like metal-dependent hydrolase (beta-lactamase superfamily II)
LKKLSARVYASTQYPGVNVGFVMMAAGAVAVDAPTLPADARAWRREVTEKAGGPILYLVLTDAHPDRLLSAGLLGAPIVASRAAYERAARLADGPWRSAAERWSHTHPDSAKALAQARPALPEILLISSLTLSRGDDRLTVECVDGAAPGSVWLDLREEGVLFAGDTFVTGQHPRMEATADSKAWLGTLKRLRRRAYEDTTIVPGRGSPCKPEATRQLSDYIAIVRRRARSLRRTGRAGLAEAVAELIKFYAASADRRELEEQQARANLEQAIRQLTEEAS